MEQSATELHRAGCARLSPRPALLTLDAALTTPITDWQRRILAATRTLAVVSASLRPSLRIALCATALEALLGDEYVPGVEFDVNGKMIRHRPVGQQHLVSQRGAYLTCLDPDDVSHHPRTGTCVYLSPSYTRLRERQYALQLGGRPALCSAYENIWSVFEDRNIALHGANDYYPESSAARHEVTMDRVLMAVVHWVSRVGATDLSQLVTEIQQLPLDDAPLPG